MALQLAFEDLCGMVHPEAYARINKIIIENPPKGEKNVSIDVCIYDSKDARDRGKAPVRGPQGYQVQRSIEVQPEAPIETQPEVPLGEQPKAPMIARPSLSGRERHGECAINPDSVAVADVYAWLKTQDEFMESTDV